MDVDYARSPKGCIVPTRIKSSDQWISDNAVNVYAAIVCESSGYKPMNFFTDTNTVARLLFYTYKPTRKQKEYVKCGFKQLYKINEEWLQPADDTEDVWEIKTVELNTMYSEEYVYATFYYYQIAIISEHCKTGTANMTAFYLKFMSLGDGNYKRKIVHYSQERLMDKFGMAKNTIRSYIDKMVDYGLICRYCPRPVYSKSGHYFNLSTIYYEPGHLATAEYYVSQVREKYMAKMRKSSKTEGSLPSELNYEAL